MASNVLIPMDVYNCFRECDGGSAHLPRYAECDVHRFMVPLITALLKDRPSWRFIFRSAGSHNPATNRYVAAKTFIFDGDDELGWIDMTWTHRNGDSYEFDSHRLRAKRDRGSSTRTKDLKKAVKLIKDHFYAPTLRERLDKAVQKTGEVLNNNRANYSYRVSDINTQLRMEINQFVLDNWEQFCRIPLTEKQAKLRDKLPDNHEGLATTYPMLEKFSSRESTIVMVSNSTYYKVQWDSTTSEYTPLAYTTDTLPAHLKAAVGMLKLVENGTPIKDMGTRIDKNLYYVMDPEQ